MDFAKFRQAIEDARRHLDKGDKEAAIALFSEALGVDRAAAATAVDQIAAGETVTVTQSSMAEMRDAAGQVEEIMATMPGGRLAEGLLKMAGLDLSQMKDAIESAGDSRRVTTSRTTVSISGGAGRHLLDLVKSGDTAGAATLIEHASRGDQPASPPTAAVSEPLRHVSVVDRPRSRTVERPGHRGGVILVIFLAVVVGIAIAYLM